MDTFTLLGERSKFEYVHLSSCKPFHLNIKHMIWIQLDPQSRLNIQRQSFFVCTFHSSPLNMEFLVVNILQQSFEQCQILKPRGLGNLEGLRDKVAQTRVALHYSSLVTRRR